MNKITPRRSLAALKTAKTAAPEPIRSAWENFILVSKSI